MGRGATWGVILGSDGVFCSELQSEQRTKVRRDT